MTVEKFLLRLLMKVCSPFFLTLIIVPECNSTSQLSHLTMHSSGRAGTTGARKAKLSKVNLNLLPLQSRPLHKQPASYYLQVIVYNFTVEALRKEHSPPLHHLWHPAGATINGSLDSVLSYLVPSLSSLCLRLLQLDSPSYSRAWLLTHSW